MFGALFVALLCVCQFAGCRCGWLSSPFVRTAAAPPAAAAEKNQEKKRKKEQSRPTEPTESTQTAATGRCSVTAKGASASARTAPRSLSLHRATGRPSPPPSARPQRRAARQVSHRALRTATRARRECEQCTAYMCAVIARHRSGGRRRWLLTLQHRWQRGSSFSFSFVREPRRRPPPPSLTPLYCAGLCVLCSMMHAAS